MSTGRWLTSGDRRHNWRIGRLHERRNETRQSCQRISPVIATTLDHRFTICRAGQTITLQWRHNGRDIVSNHQPHHCLLNGWFRRRSKETSKLRVTGLCAGNSPVTGEFPAQMANNTENVSIWWRHHEKISDRGHYTKWPTRFCRPFWIMTSDQRPTLPSALYMMVYYQSHNSATPCAHTMVTKFRDGVT